MTKINKIIIGALTYGNLPRVNGWVKSLYGNMEDVNRDITIVVCDDGTPDVAIVREREQFCKEWGVQFVHCEKQEGIIPPWKKIAAIIPDADLVILCSDTLRFITPGWLTRVIFAYENNPDLTCVSFPIISGNGYDDANPCWYNPPRRMTLLNQVFFVAKPKGISAFPMGPDASFFSCILPWPPLQDVTFSPTEQLVVGEYQEPIVWFDRDNHKQEALI